MTLDELRSWHAERLGHWFSIDRDLGPIGWCDSEGRLIGDNPFTESLDAAASAMPKGWYWLREGGSQPNPNGLYLKWVACQQGSDRWKIVTAPDTGDEIYDRYALAKLAWEAEAKEKA